MRIGFAILSHANPPQLLRLVRTLQRLYDNPPIVCHHDFSQSGLDKSEFPKDVRFVLPHTKTGWGKFSIVEAGLRSIELLYTDHSPDWFVLLSAADYPTMSPNKVSRDLSTINVDALLDFREVTKTGENAHPPENPSLRHYASADSVSLAWRRYIGFNAWIPTIRSGPRLGRNTISFNFEGRNPYGPTFKCYYGDQWFTGNHKVAELLTRPTEKHLELRRHLYRRVVPDECYYHTILANTPGIKISKATRRFTEWLDGGYHPQNLGIKDLPAIFSSECHFARKFVADSPVLDEIDRRIY